jgi:hypothetical protein
MMVITDGWRQQIGPCALEAWGDKWITLRCPKCAYPAGAAIGRSVGSRAAAMASRTASRWPVDTPAGAGDGSAVPTSRVGLGQVGGKR